jgi:hypothetical protein
MDEMRSGPIDLVLLRFPGNEFDGGIAPALRDLVDQGTVRVVDILFVYKDAAGTVGSIELGALGPQLDQAFIDIDGQLGGGLLDRDDVDEVGKDLDPNSSIAVVAIENVWAIPFIEAVRAAGGELVDQARVPSQVVDEIRAGAS